MIVFCDIVSGMRQRDLMMDFVWVFDKTVEGGECQDRYLIEKYKSNFYVGFGSLLGGYPRKQLIGDRGSETRSDGNTLIGLEVFLGFLVRQR